MKRCHSILLCVLVTMLTALFPISSEAEPKSEKPNLLFILADDCTYSVLNCYGGKDVKTPHIDRLATDGLLFTRAYCTAAMCAPFRAELYTGLYPVRNGVVRNHGKAKPGTKSVAHYLTNLGYRVGLSGKRHFGPANVFPFKSLKGFPAGDAIQKFVSSDNSKPFCLFLCSNSPHAPWTAGDASAIDAAKLTLTPTQHDNAATREVMTRYLAEVADLDREVGEALAMLKKSGQADNTLVIFCSEQGWPLGFAKWTNWDLGVHTGMIARWPGKIAAGTKTDALVQIADVLPTFIELAGGETSKLKLDGKSFANILQGKATSHRQYVYGLHNNVPEGEPYPIRSIRDDQYHYIRNLKHNAAYHEKHIMVANSRLIWWPALKAAADGGDGHAKQLMKKFHHRPAEELYLVDADPYELTNLAADPKHANAKQRLAKELDAWMKQQGDPGAAMDGKTPRRKKAKD